MKDPCIICNAEARAQLPESERLFVEDLLQEFPPACAPELSPQCWNCRGKGVVDNADAHGTSARSEP